MLLTRETKRSHVSRELGFGDDGSGALPCRIAASQSATSVRVSSFPAAHAADPTTLRFGRDDKGRGVAQVGTVSGRVDRRSLHCASLRSQRRNTPASPPKLGCPILRVVGEGWDKQNLRGKGFGGRAVVSHISPKTSEMWGTRAWVVTEERKRQSFDGASPRLSYPTYAGATWGTRTEWVGREEWMITPRFIPP